MDINYDFIYNHVDYRELIKEYLEKTKIHYPQFSLSQLCIKAGNISKSYLSMVINKKRNLSPPKVLSLGKAMGFKSKELVYFEVLARFSQAENSDDKEFYLNSLVALRPKQIDSKLSFEQYHILENWHCLVIRELVELPNFNPDPKVVSRRLRNLIRPKEVKRAWELLLRTGLVINSEDGSYQKKDAFIKTTDEIRSHAIQRYHKSCLDLGKKMIDKTSVKDREFSSVNLNLTREEFEMAKSKIKEFRDGLVTLGSSYQDSKTVCQFNMQLFKISDDQNYAFEGVYNENN